MIPTQIVALVTVMRKACASPLAETSTAPIVVIPRFSIRSPTLAHTTIARTMTSVLIRSLVWLAINKYLGRASLVVARRWSGARHGNNRLIDVAALPHPLQTFRAQFQEAGRFVIQALAFVAVPQRFAHDAPRDLRPEVVIVIEAVHAVHHIRLRQMRIFNVRELVSTVVGQRFHAQESVLGHLLVQFGAWH